MANCAVVNDQTYVVENVIVADPSTDTPPAGTFFIPLYRCDIGWKWIDANTGFVPES